MDLSGSHRTVSREVRSGFVTGLVLIAPLAITVWVVRLVYGWIVGYVSPFLNVAMAEVDAVVEFVAVLVLLGLITVLGVTVRHGFGHFAVEELDGLAKAVPVVRRIYSSVRQASNALVSDREQFERVALVEWPRPGYHTIGLVADETPEELSAHLELGGEPQEQRYNVYVPMSPNPTGGFLAIVPESKLVMTDMEVGEALNVAITTGVSGDEEFSLEQFVPDPADPDPDPDPEAGDPAA